MLQKIYFRLDQLPDAGVGQDILAYYGRPSLSSAFKSVSRSFSYHSRCAKVEGTQFSAYDLEPREGEGVKRNLLSKKRCSSAFSNPAAAASCKGELVQKVTRVLAARQALIRSAGPISQPTLHPVAEKFFPALPTVTVLFQKLSSDAMRTCLDGLSASTSY